MKRKRATFPAGPRSSDVASSFKFHMEVGEWLAVEAYRAEREAGLRSKNESRQRDAGRDHQEYRDVARKLYAQGRASRRSTRNRLAQLIQTELAERGKAVSISTIKRAFPAKK